MFSQSKEDVKLEWMYKGPNSAVDREEYLLGRPADKTLEQLNDDEKQKQVGLIQQPKNHVEHECIPPSIRDYKKQQLLAEQVDIQNKLQEDPLIAIKRREEESRRQFLNNPVQLKKLQEALEAQKVLKKQKKKKKKKSKKKSYSDSDSESDIDSKLVEKIKLLKKFPTELALANKLKDKKATKSEKEEVLNVILMHKFNALKSNLTEEDMQNILAGKITDSDTENDSDSTSSSGEEKPVKKHRKGKKKKSKKKEGKRKIVDDEVINSEDEGKSKVTSKNSYKKSKQSYSESSSDEINEQIYHKKRSNERKFGDKNESNQYKTEKRNDSRKETFHSKRNQTEGAQHGKRSTSEESFQRNKHKERKRETSKNRERRNKNDLRDRERDESEESNRIRKKYSEYSERSSSRRSKKERELTSERKYSNRSKRKENFSSSNEEAEKYKRHRTQISSSSERKHSESDMRKISDKRVYSNPKHIKTSGSREANYDRKRDPKAFSGNSTKIRYSSSESSSETDSRSKKNYGLVGADGKKIPLQKTSSKEKSEAASANSVNLKENTMKPPERPKCKELSRQERERRIKEMMENAAWRDKERAETVRKHRESESRETKSLQQYNPEFLHKELLKSANSSTVESRIKANLNNIQRSSGDMSSNFSRRY